MKFNSSVELPVYRKNNTAIYGPSAYYQGFNIIVHHMIFFGKYDRSMWNDSYRICPCQVADYGRGTPFWRSSISPSRPCAPSNCPNMAHFGWDWNCTSYTQKGALELGSRWRTRDSRARNVPGFLTKNKPCPHQRCSVVCLSRPCCGFLIWIIYIYNYIYIYMDWQIIIIH